MIPGIRHHEAIPGIRHHEAIIRGNRHRGAILEIHHHEVTPLHQIREIRHQATPPPPDPRSPPPRGDPLPPSLPDPPSLSTWIADPAVSPPDPAVPATCGGGVERDLRRASDWDWDRARRVSSSKASSAA
ncbi:hypothetical protein GN958_ATG20931 [Phytophthora infestans]|uniref:Uncharacterized protein n=1 Tax=Phytophthora infestans TaxID=4787 RepID=A0A8S9TLN9_PHYIN|nr:hypothetical protein GN958_ATG20931 [Phytophthora infestans]